jgi:hypothetical protein
MVAACLFSGVEERHFLFRIGKIQASVFTVEALSAISITDGF